MLFFLWAVHEIIKPALASTPSFESKRIGLKNIPFRFLLILACAILLSSCGISTGSKDNDLSGWVASNVVWLGSGETEQPDGHLIAAYYRKTDLDSQIRLDLLEMPDFYQSEIIIALDTIPGGAQTLPEGNSTQLAWDILFVFDLGQPPSTLFANGNQIHQIIPRLVQDTRLDTLVISWNKNILQAPLANLQFQVFIIDPISKQIISQTPALRANSSAHVSAPLVLAFWNCLPAATPAQALRRWDGAHTGPLGQRHGLNVLLGLAREYRVPLTLLDLRLPESLNALDYMQVSHSVKTSAVTGEVTIPALAWGDPALSSLSLGFSTEISQNLGWTQSSIAFGPFQPPLPSSMSHFFADLPDRSHVVYYQGRRLIPLPESPYQGNPPSENPLSPSGLSQLVKNSLLNIALSSDPTDLLVLGGNLTASMWAENSIAPDVFAYIASHPWISVLSTEDLLQFPAVDVKDWPLPGCTDLLCTPSPVDFVLLTSQGTQIPSGFTYQQLLSTLRTEISLLPNNLYAQYAVNTFLSLTASSSNPNLANLRANYLSQVGYLIFAARWADHPVAYSSCSLDIDWDGLPECILASEHTLLLIELDGGRLVFAGSPTAQWIAPSSQFSIGMGDPDSWKLNNGPAADPQVIPGAFGNSNSSYSTYRGDLTTDQAVLTLPGTTEHKSLTLIGDSLLIEISGITPFRTQIPLVVDTTFLPPSQWAHRLLLTCLPDRCELPYASGRLIITSHNLQIQPISFLESAPFMLSAEIPDRAYPQGHYLPFHIAALDLQPVDYAYPISIFLEIR